MMGAGAIGLVYGWIAAMSLAVFVGRTLPDAARLRIVGLSLLQLAFPILTGWYYFGGRGASVAVAGSAFGLLLATMVRATWAGRRPARTANG